MQEVELGGLRFRVEFRSTPEDRGPAIRVFGDVDGQPKQILRFDCFEDDPHYHYDPTGTNTMFHLDPLTMGSPLEFSLNQIGQRVIEMIAKAGFQVLSSTIDGSLIRAGIDQIRDAVSREESSQNASV